MIAPFIVNKLISNDFFLLIEANMDPDILCQILQLRLKM